MPILSSQALEEELWRGVPADELAYLEGWDEAEACSGPPETLASLQQSSIPCPCCSYPLSDGAPSEAGVACPRCGARFPIASVSTLKDRLAGIWQVCEKRGA